MYTATFTLTQDDEGMVTPSLVFDPLIDPSKDDAPPIYGFMADCALSFFRAAELIDDNGNMTEFADVEALDDVKTDDNKKYCTKKLKVGAKINFPALVQASLNFELEKTLTKDTKIQTTSKDFAKIGGGGVKKV